MRFQFVQIDFNQLVIILGRVSINFLIRTR